jgi:hydrogenase maturation protease
MTTIAVIGSGNAFFKDEGAGLYAAKYLKENYDFSPAVKIVDGGTLGFRLMPMLQEFERIIIVNTSSDGSMEPGTIAARGCDEFLGESLVKKTANEVEIAEMLQICSLTERMAETTVVSIVPEDIVSVEVGLSGHLKGAWSSYIETILRELASIGVSYRQRGEGMTLETILNAFADPSIEHNRGF